MSKKVHVKTGDTVVVINGKDRGMTGKVLQVSPSEGKVIGVSPKEGKVMVEGVHIVSKHVKPKRQGESGGIVKVEGAIYANKVMLYCSKCGAGRRTRVRFNQDGTKARVCVKCGEEL